MTSSTLSPLNVACEICRQTTADVYCTADQSAMCITCDRRIHTMNKVSQRHKRISLTATALKSMPQCDICQAAPGIIFCRDDRALLCANCDASIHSANHKVKAHSRFLISSSRVEVEDATDPTLPIVGNKRSNYSSNNRMIDNKSVTSSKVPRNNSLNKKRQDVEQEPFNINNRIEAASTAGVRSERTNRDSVFGSSGTNGRNSSNEMAYVDGNPIGQLLQIPNLGADYGLKDVDVDDFGDFSNEEWEELQYALFEAPQSVPDDYNNMYGGMGGGMAINNSNIDDDVAVPDFGNMV